MEFLNHAQGGRRAWKRQNSGQGPNHFCLLPCLTKSQNHRELKRGPCTGSSSSDLDYGRDTEVWQK